ncbi:MAG TPA: glutaminase A [Clostridia bacterium]|nr:glutaminase A [Clostridia bacterium]
MSLNELVEEIIEESKIYIENGNVATYIPELGKMDKNILGISITDFQGNIYNAGCTDVKFTLQSISKPIVLLLALLENGEEVFNKVGMEPTGDPFNSMIRLETFDTGKPLNPMINAGAITVASMIKGPNLMEKVNKVLNLIRLLANNDDIKINDKVFQSELRTGHRNRAIAYFLKDNGIIEGNVDDALALYFKQCSVEVTTQDLANIAMVLANDGIDFKTNRRLIPSHYANLVKSLMLTCGLYDHSGEFASIVGFPAKSGVSGGILGVAPRKLGIGVIGPALDIKGNSIAGVKVLEKLSNVLDLNIFK